MSTEIEEAPKLSNEERNRNFFGHWNFHREKQNGHLAVFPEEMPRKPVNTVSFVGYTVSDPFLGGGTISLAAMKLYRNSISCEINGDYLEIIKNKLVGEQSTLFRNRGFNIVSRISRGRILAEK